MFIDGIYLFNLLDPRLTHIETETEIFQMYMGRDHGHPYILSTTVLSDRVSGKQSVTKVQYGCSTYNSDI